MALFGEDWETTFSKSWTWHNINELSVDDMIDRGIYQADIPDQISWTYPLNYFCLLTIHYHHLPNVSKQ